MERDAISADLERKHAELVRTFLYELHEVGTCRENTRSRRWVERGRGEDAWEMTAAVPSEPFCSCDECLQRFPSHLSSLQVADSFAAQKQDPVVPKNAAPHSGALAWVRGLRERVTGEAGLGEAGKAAGWRRRTLVQICLARI